MLFSVQVAEGIVFATSYETLPDGSTREVARIKGRPFEVLPALEALAALAPGGALALRGAVAGRDWRRSGVRRAAQGAFEDPKVLGFDAAKPVIKPGIVRKIIDLLNPFNRSTVAAEKARGGDGLRSCRVVGIRLDQDMLTGRRAAAGGEPLMRHTGPAGKRGQGPT